MQDTVPPTDPPHEPKEEPVEFTTDETTPESHPAQTEATGIETTQFESMAPEYVACEWFGTKVAVLIFTIGLVIAAPLAFIFHWPESPWREIGTVGWFLFILFLLGSGRVTPRWTYRRTKFCLDDRGIEIHQGIWWRRVTNVPKSRVQHIEVNQGPILRKFGLGTLTIHTAGTSDSSVVLGGIYHSRALEIRADLLEEDTAIPRPDEGTEFDDDGTPH